MQVGPPAAVAPDAAHRLGDPAALCERAQQHPLLLPRHNAVPGGCGQAHHHQEAAGKAGCRLSRLWHRRHSSANVRCLAAHALLLQLPSFTQRAVRLTIPPELHHGLDNCAISGLIGASLGRAGAICAVEPFDSLPTVQLFLQGHAKGVTCVEWSRTYKFIASGSLDRLVMLWNPFSQQPLATLQVVACTD